MKGFTNIFSMTGIIFLLPLKIFAAELKPGYDIRQNKTVLVFGTTQSGKSSFIKLLHTLSGKTPPDTLKIGNAIDSCTDQVCTYSLELTPKAYNQSLIELFDDEKNMPNPPEPVALSPEPIMLKIIDTPGLDDRGDRKDEINILKILNAISKEHQVLDGVIFVVNSTTPASNSFKKFFSYYYSMFEELRSNFMMVHTRFDQTRDDIDPEMALLRAQRLEAALHDIIGTQKLRHVFVNSVWNTKRPRLSKFQTAFAEQSLSRFLLLLKSFNPVTLSEVYYTKTSLRLCHAEKINAGREGLIAGYIDAICQLPDTAAFGKTARSFADLLFKRTWWHNQKTQAERELLLIDNEHLIEVACDFKDEPYEKGKYQELCIAAKFLCEAKFISWDLTQNIKTENEAQSICYPVQGHELKGTRAVLVGYVLSNIVNKERIVEAYKIKAEADLNMGIIYKNIEELSNQIEDEKFRTVLFPDLRSHVVDNLEKILKNSSAKLTLDEALSTLDEVGKEIDLYREPKK